MLREKVLKELLLLIFYFCSAFLLIQLFYSPTTIYHINLLPLYPLTSSLHHLQIHSPSVYVQKGASFPWDQQSLAYQIAVGLCSSPCIKVEQGNPL